jgi:hypothetical protein
MSLFFNMLSYYLPPSSFSVSLRGPLLFCSNDEQQKGSPFVSFSLSLTQCYARPIALSLDLKPCRTSRLLLVVNNNNNNNNNNKDSE